MKIVLLGALCLLSSPTLAAPFTADECEFLQQFFENCARGPQGSPPTRWCSGLASGSEGHRFTDFRKAHPKLSRKHLTAQCDRVCSGELAIDQAVAGFCRPSR
jgi:hypothetical protein